MSQESLGGIYIEIELETKQMMEASQKAQTELDSLTKSAQGATPGFDKLSKGALGVSTALAMPEVNRLSTQLAQLAGSLGVSSDSATEAAASQSKFHGVLGTVASKIGGGYVSNVGSATNSLIKHTQAAIDAVDAQLKNAEAVKKEAEALRGAAQQLSVKSEAEIKLAESNASTAESELKAAEAVFERRQADIESLEALLTRQKESLKQSEANLQITNSEKAVADAVRARNAVDVTQNKIIRQSNAAIKDVTTAEDKLAEAKAASVAATQKLTQARELEAVAATTVEKANEAVAIASDKVTTANKAQAAAVGGARQALALLGGPSGVLLLAAAGVYQLYQAMSDNSKIEQYKKDIDEAAGKIEYLTKVQAAASGQKTKMSLDVDRKSLTEASSALERIRAQIETVKSIGGSTKYIDTLNGDLVIAMDSVRELSESVRIGEERLKAFGKQALNAGSVTQEQASANEIYDNTIKSVTASNDLLTNALTDGLHAAQSMAAEKELRRALYDNGIAAEETERQVSRLKAAFVKRANLTFEQELASIQSNVEALKIEMTQGELAAIAYRASLDGMGKGYSPEQVNEYVLAKKEEFKITQQIAEQNKKIGKKSPGAKKEDPAVQSLARQQAQLDRLNTGYAEGSLEIAKYDAVQALGTKATPKQIAAAEAQAASIWEVQKAVKAAADEEQKRKQAAQNFSGLQGQASPVMAVDNQYEAMRQQLVEYAAFNKDKITEVEAVRASIEEQYRKQRMAAQWQELSQMGLGYDMLTSAVDSLAGNASNVLTGLITGSMSAEEAFRSLGSTVLNSVVNSIVQVGVEMLKNFILAQTVGVASQAANATAATAGGAAALAAWTPAAIAASIATAGAASGTGIAAYTSAQASGAALSVLGARRQGGPVAANQMYRIGEGGAPEIYQTSNGNQYMIPGDRGKVISNKDMQNGGVNVVINVTNNTSAQTQFSQSYDQQSNTLTVQGFISDMQEKGPMHRAITQNTSATTRL